MPDLATLRPGDPLPGLSFEPTAVSLFLYNAIIWNAHRIHYDAPYTTGVEHHPGVVIDGPLQGDWLTQVVLEWLGDAGQLVEFEYSNRRASYLGERLTAAGRIEAIDRGQRLVTVTLDIRNAAGEVTSPGRAVVRLDG
jgi:3-methylfumaryl-CoA hydratase